MNIQNVWHSFYGERVPIAYLLRKQIPDVWFRIHSLPESKRYAENEEETHELLRRHHIIANEVLGDGVKCLWFVHSYPLQNFSSTFAAFSGHLFCHYKDDDVDISLFASLGLWNNYEFDAILSLVADDAVGLISWMNIESGEIFAPYDGGVDVFCSSTARRDELRAQFSEWLSPFPGGT